MSYSKILQQILEMTSDDTFGPTQNIQTDLTHSSDTYAPGDARNIWGSSKKSKGKRKKIPMFKRHYVELMNAESVEQKDLVVECVLRTKTTDQLNVVKKILEQNNHSYITADPTILTFENKESIINSLIEKISTLIDSENFVTIIAETYNPDKIGQNQIRGGKSDEMTIRDIANKHGVSVEEIEKQLTIGISVENEHTNNKKLAQEIALDHLDEFPNYYTELKKFETNLKAQNG